MDSGDFGLDLNDCCVDLGDFGVGVWLFVRIFVIVVRNLVILVWMSAIPNCVVVIPVWITATRVRVLLVSVCILASLVWICVFRVGSLRVLFGSLRFRLGCL